MATNGSNWEDDDPEDQNEGQAQKPVQKNGLREHARKTEQENAELKAKLAELEKAERKRTVSEAVKAKGYDPEVVDLVPDAVANDDVELDKWLIAKEKLFKPVKAEQEENVNQGYDDEGNSMNDDADAYDRISRVNSGALPAAKAQDLRARILAAKTRAELDEILRAQGNQNVG